MRTIADQVPDDVMMLLRQRQSASTSDSQASTQTSQASASAPPTVGASTSSRASGYNGIAGGIANATTTASRLLAEIARRWPGQAGHWRDDTDMTASWARALLRAQVDGRELAGALDSVSARPYPPDLGALLAAVEERREQHRRDLLRRPCLPPPPLTEAEIERNRQRIAAIKARFFARPPA
jgi:hypothetical protein